MRATRGHGSAAGYNGYAGRRIDAHQYYPFYPHFGRVLLCANALSGTCSASESDVCLLTSRYGTAPRERSVAMSIAVTPLLRSSGAMWSEVSWSAAHLNAAHASNFRSARGANAHRCNLQNTERGNREHDYRVASKPRIRFASQSRIVVKYTGTKRCNDGISALLPTFASS